MTPSPSAPRPIATVPSPQPFSPFSHAAGFASITIRVPDSAAAAELLEHHLAVQGYAPSDPAAVWPIALPLGRYVTMVARDSEFIEPEVFLEFARKHSVEVTLCFGNGTTRPDKTITYRPLHRSQT